MIINWWKGGNFFMLKKTMPFVFLSALLLGACTNGNDGALPRNDETPMENFDNRERNWTPRMEDERRGGTDIDGLENDNNRNGGGILNDERNNLQNDRNDPLLDNNNDPNLNNRNNR